MRKQPAANLILLAIRGEYLSIRFGLTVILNKLMGRPEWRPATEKRVKSINTRPSVSLSAHKKGEVVEPAGGETGVPRCLAEVLMLFYRVTRVSSNS